LDGKAFVVLAENGEDAEFRLVRTPTDRKKGFVRKWFGLFAMLFGLFAMLFGLFAMLFGLFAVLFGLFAVLFGLFAVLFGLFAMLFGLFAVLFGLFRFLTAKCAKEGSAKEEPQRQKGHEYE
jgi:ABC-type multidrug transport system fused ATPase/permease subunit